MKKKHMKTRLFFTCIFFSFAWQANAQTEFAPIGSEWYYNIGYFPGGHFNHIVSEKDTLVEGDNCRILRQYSDDNVANEKYIVKQDQGKVYYYHQDKFHLLFDFDAKVNDIIEFTFKYQEFNNFPVSLLPKDTVLSIRFLVEDVTINAQNLKTFRTKAIDEDAHKLSGVYYAPSPYYIYTEKTGWNNEFMPNLDNAAHPDAEVFCWLRCYSETDFSFVSDEWSVMSLPCNYSVVSSINTPKDRNDVEVYPILFKDNVFVFTSRRESIEIIDLSGKVVYHSELSKGGNEIPTSHLPTGFYLMKISSVDGAVQFFKIVKS